MSTAAKHLFRWHRWLGWLVGLQVLAWVAGGTLFAWLPFQAWVKGADVLATPRQPLPPGWTEAARAAPLHDEQRGALLAVQSVATARGAALRLRYERGQLLLSAAGGPLPPPDAQHIGAYARALYKGAAPLLEVRRLDEVPPRLGLVRELGPRRDVWQVGFDDALKSRFYFEAASGELLAVRNEAWVLYDFFWRLHLMDYRGGEDFNNSLLRGMALLALLMALTGLALSVLALRRAWRRRQDSRFTPSSGQS